MVFTGFAWHVAILQSSTEIAAWLANTNLVRDISVVLNIDVLLSMAFCLLAANIKIGEHVGRKARWLYAFFTVLSWHYDCANSICFACWNHIYVSGRRLLAHCLDAWRCVLWGYFAAHIHHKAVASRNFLTLRTAFSLQFAHCFGGHSGYSEWQNSRCGNRQHNFGALAGTLALVVVVGIVGMLWQRWHTKRQMKQLE